MSDKVKQIKYSMMLTNKCSQFFKDMINCFEYDFKDFDELDRAANHLNLICTHMLNSIFPESIDKKVEEKETCL